MDFGTMHAEITAALVKRDIRGARDLLERAERLSLGAEFSALDSAQFRLALARVCAAEEDDPSVIREASAALECGSGVEGERDVGRVAVQATLDLGDAHVASGDYQTAGEILYEALGRARMTLGEDDPDTASAWNSVGMCHRYRGDVESAADAYEHARRILERRGATDDLAAVLHNEASLAHLQGDLAQAESFIRRALGLRNDPLGIAEDLGVLAVVLADGDRFGEAQAAYDKARATLSQCDGPKCVELVLLSGNEAVLSYRRGWLDEAYARYTNTLVDSEALLGVEHPYTGEVLANLGALQELTGDTQGARASAERALAILGASVEETHPSLRLASDILAATGR